MRYDVFIDYPLAEMNLCTQRREARIRYGVADRVPSCFCLAPSGGYGRPPRREIRAAPR
jgi:hypothetical protein